MGGLLRPAHTHESLTRELRPAFGANRGQGTSMPLSATRKGRAGPLGRQPSAAGTFQMPQYKPPAWPDRPEYQAPEKAFDLKRAMAAAIEAELLPDEFSSILDQMGMVNESERNEALGAYSLELETYKDEMGRMEFEREEEATGKKSAIERIEEQRRYGLDVAKEARGALAAERKFGLELEKHGLEVEKAGKTKWAGSPQEALFKRKTALGVAGIKAEKTFKKEQRTSEARLKAADTKYVRSLEKELRKQEAELMKQEAEGRNVLIDGKAEPIYEATKNSVQVLKDKIGELKGTKKAGTKDAMAEMPPAEQYGEKGVLTDTKTGKRYKSDGTQWIEID